MPFRDPFSSNSTCSRKTSDSSDLSEYLRPSAFPGHRDTLARVQFRQPSAPWIPENVLSNILSHLSFSDYKALRLTSRQWDESLPQPQFPPSYRMPAEVLQQIYSHLLPSEFDAARHTCRSWFLASLDKGLQKQMLRKAACLQASQIDVENIRAAYDARALCFYQSAAVDHENTQIGDCHQPELEDLISEEWLLSKRLATESKLSAEWKGTGLKGARSAPGGTLDRLYVTEEINFTSQVHEDYSTTRAMQYFNVSACAKFVLLVDQRHVLIYDCSRTSSPEPVTRLDCGRDVLGVSMDTSSGRQTVAVLLDGRIGMCWDLGQNDALHGESLDLGLETDVYTSDPQPTLGSRLPDQPPCRAAIHAFGFVNGRRWTSDISTRFPVSANFRPREISQHGDFPTTVFKNIGSPDDSPRSVALCPQRKCVAFGCKSGIELHWVDALTGGDLNRWFPLAAPSDHLYFLPQRSGDSTKKLRLISSAAGPVSPTMSTRSNSTQHETWPATRIDTDRRRSMTRLFFGSLPFPPAVLPGAWQNSVISSNEDRQGVLRTVDCDHYRAVPLSDGVNVLFTDPETSLVCMGSDAPLGGPTKLLRKAILLPPESATKEWPSTVGVSPLCYSAGSDLMWGLRIVVAYSDGSLILYNIPSDVFERIRYVRSTPNVWDELAGVIAESDVAMDHFLNYQDQDQNQEDVGHPNASTQPQAGNEAASSARPQMDRQFTSLQVVGSEISRTKGQDHVEDLMVDSSFGGLRFWVFLASGKAVLWDMYMPRGQEVRRRSVSKNGVLVSNNNWLETSASAEDKGNETSKEERHIRFSGMDGSSDTKEDRGKDAQVSPGRCEPIQIEVLTDWRLEQLFEPYLVSLN